MTQDAVFFPQFQHITKPKCGKDKENNKPGNILGGEKEFCTVWCTIKLSEPAFKES